MPRGQFLDFTAKEPQAVARLREALARAYCPKSRALLGRTVGDCVRSAQCTCDCRDVMRIPEAVKDEQA